MSLYANSFECMLVPVSQLFSVFAVRNTVVTISLTRLNLPGFRMPLCNCVYVCVCAFQTYKFVCRHSSRRKCVLLFVEFSNSPFFSKLLSSTQRIPSHLVWYCLSNLKQYLLSAYCPYVSCHWVKNPSERDSFLLNHIFFFYKMYLACQFLQKTRLKFTFTCIFCFAMVISLYLMLIAKWTVITITTNYGYAHSSIH